MNEPRPFTCTIFHIYSLKQVSKERGEQLAVEYGIKFIETSAKSSVNVEHAFFTLARDIKAKVEKKLVSYRLTYYFTTTNQYYIYLRTIIHLFIMFIGLIYLFIFIFLAFLCNLQKVKALIMYNLASKNFAWILRMLHRCF